MFLQHHSTASSTVLSQAASNVEDFELLIKSKGTSSIQGKIRFEYLEQSFQAQIIITESGIQVKSLYPFAGILASAPALTLQELEEGKYLQNGSLTKKGHQNIVWLTLDLIHLYNLLRFKPALILELYREAFLFAKEKDNTLVFGQLSIETNIAKATAKFLGQITKRKTKYVYGSNLDLLASFQEILANYPQQFLLPKALQTKLEPALS
jgi:hypothetical protein